MYTKLIFRNAKRSVGQYLIYIVTLTICVSMFYAILSVTSNYYQPQISDLYSFDVMNSSMQYIIVGVGLILIFLDKTKAI